MADQATTDVLCRPCSDDRHADPPICRGHYLATGERCACPCSTPDGRYVCPCEGPAENLRDPDELCDDAAYPPKGIRICRRHGTDPCHDDAWHYVDPERLTERGLPDQETARG